MHCFVVFALLAVVKATPSEKATYENYKVFQIVPTSSSQVEVLNELQDGEGVS